MADPKALQEYKGFIEQTLVAMGRDDVGVGDVVDKGDGMLGVTLSRGSHTHTVDVPVASLQQNEQARVAMTRAMFGLSKEIEQETIDTAARVAKE